MAVTIWYSNTNGGGAVPSHTQLTGILTAGNTTLTFNNNAIKDNVFINIYTNKYGINPNEVVAVEGTLTLTFDALTTDINVRVEIITPQGSSANLITFTVGGISYLAAEGMNWVDWCDSEYNTDSFYRYTDSTYDEIETANSERRINDSTGLAVNPTSVIQSGVAYEVGIARTPGGNM